MTNNPKAGNGIDPELLAAYIDKRLSPEERAAVEATLATDRESYELLVELMKAHDELGGVVTAPAKATPAQVVPMPRRVSPTRRWIVAGGGLLAAAAAIVLVVRLQPDLLQRLRGGEAVDPQLAKLVAAVGEERYIEARLTGGFKYGPLRSVTRGPGDLSQQNLALLAAAGELQKKALEDPSAENLHAWGVAQLVLGDLDGGILSLESAAEDRRDQPGLSSDLAAAYLARAKTLDRSEDVPKALVAAEHALVLDANSREALFNKALSLSFLNLREQSRKAWTDYLAIDPDSEWSTEARKALAALDVVRGSDWPDRRTGFLTSASAGRADEVLSVTRAFTQQARELVEDDLLPLWGTQYLRTEATAASTLAQIGQIARAVRIASGDPFLTDVFDHVSNHTASAADSAAMPLANGMARYGEARKFYEANRISDAVESFRHAGELLRSARSPMATWCAHYMAVGLYYAGNHAAALAAQGRVLATTESRSYRIISGRARWMRGLSGTLTADYFGQIAEYQLALALFTSAGERENQAAIHNLLSSAYLYLGDQAQLWRHAVASLSETGDLTGPRRRHTTLTSSANKAIRSGLPAAALAFAEEALANARTWAAPEGFIESHQYRARALAALERDQEAAESASAARAFIPSVSDRDIRERLDAEVSQTEAEVTLRRDPARAAERASHALAFFDKHRAFLRVPRLLMTRGRARAASGAADEALADFKASVAQFERERASVPADDDTRVSHADEQWDAYRELVGAMLQAGAPHEELLAIAERSKSRTLTEVVGGGRPTGATNLLPISPSPHLTFVSFFVLPTQTLAWVVSTEGVTQRVLPAGEVDIRRHADTLYRSLRQPGGLGWQPSASRLFDALIAPLRLPQGSGLSLVISADGPLHVVPFGVLWDARRSRFMIQDFAVTQTPSLALWRGESRQRRGGMTEIAAVGYGAAVNELRLRTLARAPQEAREVAARVPGGLALVGDQATPAGLQSAFSKASVIHFAGHAVANVSYPSLSRLFVSDGAGGSTSVTARQLRQFNLENVRLAVLSACSTVAGALHEGEGVVSISRAFLMAGVSTVLGTLWEVADDGSTERVIGDFYAGWLSQRPYDESLALAQRRAISAGRPPREWGTWVLHSTAAHSVLDSTPASTVKALTELLSASQKATRAY